MGISEWSLIFFFLLLLHLLHLTHVHIHLTFHLHLHLLFFSVLACFVYDVLDVLVSISVLLAHILHLLSLHHLLFLHHLLLLNGGSVFFLWHLILLLIAFWSILNKMSVLTGLHFIVVLSVRHSVLWWRNVSTFIVIIEFDAL